MTSLTELLLEPFALDFLRRALLGGALVAVLCGVVGTWVVIRGMAFLGEALAHGMLPGVALATVLGLPVMLGGAVSAVAMSVGIGGLQRRGRLSYDTSIGLLFVSMLALGVIVISHSGSFATDATTILFGDILAIAPVDLVLLGGAAAVGLLVAVLAHRPLVALAVDPRIASVLGLRPRLAQAALVGLVTLAVVASYQAVGSLLVVGLLLAPAVAAQHWTVRIPTRMALASVIGVVAVLVGLLVSWHAATAAGASVAAAAIGLAGLSWAVRAAVDAARPTRPSAVTREPAAPPPPRPAPDHPPSRKEPVRSPLTTLALGGVLVLGTVACAGDPDAASSTGDAAPDSADGSAGHGAVAGAAEVAEPQLGLTTIDPSGAVTHLDLLDESVSDLGSVGEPSAMTTDGRYLFAQTGAGVEIVDSGVWTWDHVDHFHYYRAEPRLVGTVEGGADEGGAEEAGPATVATTNLSTSSGTGLFFPGSGDAVLLDTEALSRGEITEQFRLETEPHDGMVVPVGSFALVTGAEDGVASSVAAHTADGEPTGLEEPCVQASGTITTRVGAVIGCADGALLASVVDDELTIERIPYPADTTAPAATSFDNREGRPTVAALAGDAGIWLLDTRDRTWTLLPSPAPLVAVTAVDDADQHVLGLAADGRVLVIDGADGALLAATEPLVAESLAAGPAPVLVADQQRAYLSGPAERQLLEIDYADGARIARTFETTTEPAFTAETGR